MRRFLLPFLIIALLAACSSDKSPEALAMKAAQQSYSALVKGDYEKFLEARVGMESIPDSYREELLTSYKQFMSQQNHEHGGIDEVLALRAHPDSVLHIMQVYLSLHFNDSTIEEIVVPMVEHNGQWKMK